MDDPRCRRDARGRAGVDPSAGRSERRREVELLAALLGLIEFTGSVRFHWRGSGRIGYVPQAFAVDRTLPLTVGEFLALSRQRRPVARGSAERRATRVEACSGGSGSAASRSGSSAGSRAASSRRCYSPTRSIRRPSCLPRRAGERPRRAIGAQVEDDRWWASGRRARPSSWCRTTWVRYGASPISVTLLDRTVRRTGTPAEVLSASSRSSHRPRGAR
jgi:zinc transport system ATP-binding protein